MHGAHHWKTTDLTPRSSMKVIYALVHRWDECINLNSDSVEKKHSSTGDIYRYFYLHSNEHFGWVSVCALFFDFPLESIILFFWLIFDAHKLSQGLKLPSPLTEVHLNCRVWNEDWLNHYQQICPIIKKIMSGSVLKLVQWFSNRSFLAPRGEISSLRGKIFVMADIWY